MLINGGGGNRTRVQKHPKQRLYMLIPVFVSPLRLHRAGFLRARPYEISPFLLESKRKRPASFRCPFRLRGKV